MAQNLSLLWALHTGVFYSILLFYFQFPWPTTWFHPLVGLYLQFENHRSRPGLLVFRERSCGKLPDSHLTTRLLAGPPFLTTPDKPASKHPQKLGDVTPPSLWASSPGRPLSWHPYAPPTPSSSSWCPFSFPNPKKCLHYSENTT